MSSVVELLDASHYSALQRAISNLLDTNLAFATYAQIIDGLPTEDVAWDRSCHKLQASHPLVDHSKLCHGVADKVNAIKANFQVDSLGFDHHLLEAFQSAQQESQRFKLRLIELVAVSLHQIAVNLFQLKLNLHDPATTRGLDVDTVIKWQPEPHHFLRLVEPWPTLFTHPHFAAHTQYPNGIADLVGYWAEDRILGGVAIFDRSRTWTGNSEPHVYFQSCRASATRRIWQLLPSQQEDLAKFLVQDLHASTDRSAIPDGNGPLPIMPSRANTVRVDPIDAIPVNKVYRDVWERRDPPKLLRMQEYMEPCVVVSDDYPEMEDTTELVKRLNHFRRR